MGDDIVTRLRSENRMVLAPLHMSDAADEIEQLRSEVELLQQARLQLLAIVEGFRDNCTEEQHTVELLLLHRAACHLDPWAWKHEAGRD